VLNTVPSESVSEREGYGTPTPSNDQRGAADAKEKTPLNIKSTSADQGTPSMGTWSDKKEKAEGEGMAKRPPP
jgi:hypothetical protein